MVYFGYSISFLIDTKKYKLNPFLCLFFNWYGAQLRKLNGNFRPAY